MLPDPYRPGSTPRYLAGRDAQLATIRHHLAPVIAYGEMAGAPLVVHGPRGVGKTSLLDVAAGRAEADGFLVAWTSCVRNQPFLPDLRDSVVRALLRAEVHPPASRWEVTLERVGVELGIPALGKVTAEGSVANAKNRAETSPGAVTAVEELLRRAAQAARGGPGTGRQGVGLLVVIDELHAGTTAELGVLLNALQNLDRERERTPLAVLGAGVPAVRGALTRAATFGERTAWMAVGDLSHDDACEALMTPAAALDVSWEEDAVAVAVEHSQRYPHFVQIMGRASWRAAQPQAGDTIRVADTLQGARIGGAEIADMYAARWEASTDTERRIMRVMAELGGDGDVTRREIEAGVGRDISMARARLLNNAVIADTGRGRLRFTLPGFSDFILRETGQE